MSDLSELYQKVLLEHYKNPRNFGGLEGANHRCDGHNPLCGDRITVLLRVHSGAIEEAAFEGISCAICTSSASVMTELVKGKSIPEVEGLFEIFRGILSGKPSVAQDATGKGNLAAFAGIREFPVRVKCATLPWHTMLAALANEDELVTTE
jgi:nitrogen fixation NifU-like protein